MGRTAWVGAVCALGSILAGAGTGSAGGPLRPEVELKVCELRNADRARTSTRSCIACHDGSVGPGAGFEMRAGNQPGLDHPVDVPYAEAAARDPRLAPASALPPDVILVNGRVACTTCHDGASTERGHAVRGQPELCTSCHRM